MTKEEYKKWLKEDAGLSAAVEAIVDNYWTDNCDLIFIHDLRSTFKDMALYVIEKLSQKED